jgi:RNA-splicing ligase RtcB
MYGIIPLNMRDGSLVCVGKGNSDWNNSAPHGAGRLCGRKEALRTLNLHDFQASMRGIYSTTVGRDTLDEAPMAYKPTDEIIAATQDTVLIESHLKPIYNFKAGRG